MEAEDERTEGPTACLDLGKGATAHLCVACWARLMAWRQRQHAGQKRPAFAMLPWPLAEGGVPMHTDVDAPQKAQRRRARS